MQRIELTVNGEPRQFDAPITAADLLERMGYAGKRVAMERNGEIVPRSRLGDTPLVPGDRLEIVIAVGGG